MIKIVKKITITTNKTCFVKFAANKIIVKWTDITADEK